MCCWCLCSLRPPQPPRKADSVCVCKSVCLFFCVCLSVTKIRITSLAPCAAVAHFLYPTPLSRHEPSAMNRTKYIFLLDFLYLIISIFGDGAKKKTGNIVILIDISAIMPPFPNNRILQYSEMKRSSLICSPLCLDRISIMSARELLCSG